MPLLRYDEMVPEVYVNKSRDFQLLTRLWELGLNNPKYFADKLKYQNCPNEIESSLLPLLVTKVGFFPSSDYNNDVLRSVCNVFYALIRNKGSLLSVIELIYTFFNALNVYSDIQILTTTSVYKKVIINDVEYNILDAKNSYILTLCARQLPSDTSLLYELLDYIIPAGWIVKIVEYNDSTVQDIIHTKSIIHYITSENIGMLYKENTPNTARYLLGSVDTTSIYNTYIITA